MIVRPARLRTAKSRENGRSGTRKKKLTARRRLPRSERRAEILQTAARMFYAKGYEAASLQDIATEIV